MKSLLKQIFHAREAVAGDISSDANAGLAGEGWNGGYQAALDDVLLAFNGTQPDRWKYWASRIAERKEDHN